MKASSHRLRSEITIEGNSWDSLAKHAHTNGRIMCVISLEIKITEKWNIRVAMSDTEPDLAGMADALPDVEPHGIHREMVAPRITSRARLRA